VKARTVMIIASRKTSNPFVEAHAIRSLEEIVLSLLAQVLGVLLTVDFPYAKVESRRRLIMPGKVEGRHYEPTSEASNAIYAGIYTGPEMLQIKKLNLLFYKERTWMFHPSQKNALSFRLVSYAFSS